jgi:hypothetical protein
MRNLTGRSRPSTSTLGELDYHPALFALSDETIDRAEIDTENLDAHRGVPHTATREGMTPSRVSPSAL